MTSTMQLVSDYKNNVPLHMLEAKYNLPIYSIINILYKVATRIEESNNEHHTK